MRSSIQLTLFAAVMLGTTAGCESSSPAEQSGNQCTPSTGVGATMCEADKGLTVLDNPTCKPGTTDYQPRDNGSANDTWAACISDDNTYHPFNPSVGSNARTEAFEEMSVLLGFGGNKVPACDDFLKAKEAYAQPEGLGSRIARREDVHYPPVMKDGKEVACRDLSASEIQQNPDRCISQAKIQPLIEKAMNDGATGKDPVLNAARVEAAALWFSYVSIYKEIETCGTEDKEDCDSATGYYGGVQTRDNPIGFGSYVRARSPQAHDRVWDGLLAARCWRDLDQDMPAKNTALMKQAMDQTDRAALRGLALIVRERFQNAPTCPVALESVRILGPVLNRAAMATDPANAAVLAAEVARSDGAAINVKAASDAIDALFPCP